MLLFKARFLTGIAAGWFTIAYTRMAPTDVNSGAAFPRRGLVVEARLFD